MLAAPGAAGLRRLEDDPLDAARRATVERKAQYRAACLRAIATLLVSDDGETWPDPGCFGLTEAQTESARKALATVLRNRADGNGGRLGRA
jgi:hypothetical protein